jgi:hypothetical protein
MDGTRQHGRELSPIGSYLVAYHFFLKRKKLIFFFFSICEIIIFQIIQDSDNLIEGRFLAHRKSKFFYFQNW